MHNVQIKNVDEVKEDFRDARECTHAKVKEARQTLELSKRQFAEILVEEKNNAQAMDELFLFYVQNCEDINVDGELKDSLLEESDKQTKAIDIFCRSMHEYKNKENLLMEENIQQINQSIEALKNTFFTCSEKFLSLKTKSSQRCHILLNKLLNEGKISSHSQQIWDTIDAKNLIKKDCEPFNISENEEQLSEIEHKFSIIWHECLSIEENNNLITRIHSYVNMFNSIEQLINEINLSISSKDIVDTTEFKSLLNLTPIVERFHIFYSTVSTIIIDAIKKKRLEEKVIILEQNKRAATK